MNDPLEIGIEEVRRLRDAGNDVVVIDVRDASEFQAGHVDGAVHIPGADLATHLEALRRADVVVAVCGKGGGRSLAAATLLQAKGLEQARYLAGGTLAWLAGSNNHGGTKP